VTPEPETPPPVSPAQRALEPPRTVTADTPFPEPSPSNAVRTAPAGTALPDPASRPAAADVFPTLPGYRILRELGRGTMGVVYRAYHERLALDVALKVPHGQLMAEPSLRERFYREAQAAARLNHANLCRVLEVGSQADLPYLAMAYVPGRPLHQQSPTDAVAIGKLMHTLAVALAEAHRLGVVHRDLKPSNILITPEGEPVVTDFGLALRLDTANERLTQFGSVMGTPHYMAPEQARGDLDVMGPACDIYSLGVILFELLTGRLPFTGPDIMALLAQVLFQEPARPSQLRPEVDPRLEAICLKAMAKPLAERFATMTELADALAEYLHDTADQAGDAPARARPGLVVAPSRPLVSRDVIRLAFASLGERAPALLLPADRLYLDVGNELRPGVIDCHLETSARASTTSMVLAHPELIDSCVIRGRRADAPFVLVLHERPNLDGVAAAWLALHYLETGHFPLGADALTRYVDAANQGNAGLTPARSCSLYAAFFQLGNQLGRQTWNSNHEHWQVYVRRGLKVLDFALDQASARAMPLEEVDALACPGEFSAEDRAEISRDRERYCRKLADPRCRARTAELLLPGRTGGTVTVPALLVRGVQTPDDAEPCAFFRDWAHSDSEHCSNAKGFIALCMFLPERARQVRRCILSVTPDSGASLRGLAEQLEQAETERRREIFGVDDRVIDPTSGQPRQARPGYANADPWYDGRGHNDTLVDSPRSGTLLRAEEIEDLFLHFGGRDTATSLAR
jgi:hypothetical protein